VRNAIFAGQVDSDGKERGEHVHVLMRVEESHAQATFEAAVDLGPPFASDVFGA